MKLRIIGVGLSLFFIPLPVLPQGTTAWLRVLTEDYLLIDIRRTSLIIEEPNVVSAEFRMTLPRSQPLEGKRGAEYRYRIDRIHFELQGGRYRVSKRVYFDESQNVIAETLGEDWKPKAGRTADRFFRAVVQLPPFGSWKAGVYRYASGEPPGAEDPSELKDLIGSDLFFRSGEVRIGKRWCRAPVYEPRRLSNDVLMKLIGTDLKSFGLAGDQLNAMSLKCLNEPQFPKQTMVLFTGPGRALVLWEGVFVEIERPPNSFD